MLSIILINYYAEQLLEDCLHTLYGDKGSSRFEVIVVDNSPGDGARETLAAKYSSLRWITMKTNEGFARANNAGIKASSGDAVLLLNTDTLKHDNAISECYRLLMESEYMAAGVQLLNADGSPQISGNFVMKGGLNYLMQLPYIGSVVRWTGLKAGVAKTNLAQAKQAVTEVEWINGAFLMVKRTAIEKAGLMDEDFFLYHEESEWCSRLKRIGKLCIFGDLQVVHLEGQSTSKAFGSVTTGHSNLSDKKGYQLMLSMFVRFRKEFGLGWFLFHLLFYTTMIPIIVVCAVVHALISFSLRPVTQAIGFAANTLKCWQFVITILRNKPYFYKVL
jgi:GT2 family glycosyltransferase